MKSTLSIRITVREPLSERLAAAFDGVTLVPGAGGTGLVGDVVDQAQLPGLLTRIRDLGLTLQSVTAPTPITLRQTGRPEWRASRGTTSNSARAAVLTQNSIPKQCKGALRCP